MQQATKRSSADRLKWFVVFLLIIGGVVADYYGANVVKIATALRIIGWIVLAAIAVFVACQTHRGRLALSFIRESRIEMRKVVWPSRQETVQTTGMIMVMVLIVGGVLWLIDSGLIYVIGLITQ